MENRIGKLVNQVKRRSISLVAPLNNEAYMKALNKYMIKAGFNINGDVCYVHPTVYFDGSDYSLITLENGVSISRDVMFLTHDFSINTVYKGLDLKNSDEIERKYKKDRCRVLRPISVGSNTFIGAKAFICPGAKIGKNCLIGAGSVVRGTIPDNSVASGNPCVVLCKTSEWLEKKHFEC